MVFPGDLGMEAWICNILILKDPKQEFFSVIKSGAGISADRRTNSCSS